MAKADISKEEDQWIGLLDNRLVVGLVQRPGGIEYRLLNEKTVTDSISKKDLEKRLQAYFRLDEDLDQLYRRWSARDEHFARTGAQFRGIRLLRQDVVENIFSFICSSNNNISRISKMIEALCTNYGTKLYSFEDGDDDGDTQPDIYSFPEVDRLASDQVEGELRKLSFGYRSRYISGAAKTIIAEGGGGGDGSKWLEKLTRLAYEDARRQLMSLPGIGGKVADCICLMSLGHSEAIPVDTHGNGKGKGKGAKQQQSLTTQRYAQIGDFYRERFEEHAGWAQTVLFASHLKQSS
ncbi:8-oxoguanine glycosylase ogg1 [Tyrophagus putrescentiae]|nr:8-oxoguanine glycosylase ogg1 [Tyrophagus putrescentiae]